MKKAILFFICSFLLISSVYAQPLVCVGESDGDPYVWNQCIPGIIFDGAAVVDNNDGTATITVTGGGGGNSFETWAVPDTNNIVADSSTDTATFTESSGIDITGTVATDTINFALDLTEITCGVGLTCSVGTTIDADSASDTVVGVVELATIAETNTGTDATRVVTPDGLAGSVFGEVAIVLPVVDFSTSTTTGDGQFYFPINSKLNGMNLIRVHGQVITAGTTNTTNVDIARCADAAAGNACSGTVSDMLSTNLTIDSGEDSSDSAVTAAVIDTTVDDVSTNQVIRVDVDGVSTTPAKGLIVTLVFQLP